MLKRSLALQLAAFGRETLEGRALGLKVPVAALVRQAALYYLAERGTPRSARHVPRFIREEPEPASEAWLDVELELTEAEWSALEVEAVAQHVPLETLLQHATLLFLADIDSGRVVFRIVEDDD